MLNANIVVIDTGCDSNHPGLSRTKVSGITISKNKVILNEFSDTNGHGTAVCGVLALHKATNVFVIKLDIDNEVQTDELLYKALCYIDCYVNTKIINISVGVKCVSSNKMEAICQKLYDKGVIIVAAFDNDGFISYPAKFHSVIGVSSSDNCRHINDFELFDSDCLNFFAKGNSQKLLWLNNGYVFSGGNSFACAHLSGYINDILNESKTTDFENLFSYLKKNCNTITEYHYSSDYSLYSDYQSMNIKKAVVFPLIKETHPLIAFRNMLSFEITHVYDYRERGIVGKKATDFVFVDHNDHCDLIVENIESINWVDFDTIIIGHLIDISAIVQKDDYPRTLVEQCIRYNKNIYSFDPIDISEYDISSYTGKIFYPYINNCITPSTYTGKLYKNSTPHVGIYGTSSKQGKYTLQIILRKILLENGYVVGQIGTEPSSYLFGMDECFNFGYNSTVQIHRYDSVVYLNNAIHLINNRDPDIIISGCQSGIGFFGEGNLFNYPFPQIEFLLGTYPDSVILCVNYDDEIDDIKRSISFLESAIQCNVIALCVFPSKRLLKNDFFSPREQITEQEAIEIKEELYNTFNISSFIIGNSEDMISLYKLIVNNYSE